jgi:hypothetical protein
MRTRTIFAALLVFGAAGCGGGHQAAPAKPPPKLPRTLAQSWAQQADGVAAAIDSGDGCTALQRASALRTQVVDAVNAHQVPRRYLEPLVSTANDLAGRITCNPPVVTTDNKPGKHHKHGDHGDGGD